MMAQGLINSLTVFPIPGREHEAASRLEQQQQDIRDDAYQDGYTAGRDAASAEFASKESDLEKVATQMLSQIEQVAHQVEASHRRALLNILNVALPNLVNNQALIQIRDFVAESTASQLSGSIILNASPELLGELQAFLAKEPFTERLTLIPSDDKEGYDVELFWDSGSAEINPQDVVERCLAVVNDTAAPESGG